MKKFDVKSLVAGIIIGTIGVTTVFAANGIKSATISNTGVTLNGVDVRLNKPLVALTMDNEQNSSLYMPLRELLEYLGYTVEWDNTRNTINLLTVNKAANNWQTSNSHEIIGEIIYNSSTIGDTVLNLNNRNAFNIAESGSFRVENNQTLVLKITSTVKGGFVDLFLFDPNGCEQRITIGETTTTKEIALTRGIWQYNCSGMFKDGGDIRIVGTIG